MYREDFPMFENDIIYLDNGATTLKPQPVIDAVVNYYTYLGANAHRGDYEMSAQVDAAFEGARVRTQKFLNAKHKEEIVFTSGSSESNTSAIKGVCFANPNKKDLFLFLN